ncbi:Ig-like domain-containing protein [Terrilactibacillus laevilacticus]|uniref:Ig-like domain-containing protein n=1 Tax=Terrilactibacillus laevilacticus TaxID=1380157 RepID=A0ABW5PRL5_9BACI|nr:Ig-like domain-containing protein [Terrilactibacillus laevilacticus]
MVTIRRILYIFLATLLVFSFPMGVFAKSHSVYKSTKQSNLNQKTVPLKEKKGDMDYLNPNDYPLISPGGSAGTLIDSYGSRHQITYNSTIESSTDQMKVLLGYQNATYYKDPYLYIEFYTNNNGSMDYLGSSTFDVSNSSYAILGTPMDKSIYENDPYIYMRVGTLADYDDRYYSDVTYFKVSNPFYKGSTETDASSNYVLVSNESTDGGQSESSGTFELNNNKYAFNKKIGKDAYKLDYIKPFDAKDKSKVRNRNTKSIKSQSVLGDSKDFWVSNLETNTDYQINATLLYSGEKTNVWVNNNQLTSQGAEVLGKEFDDKIHPSDVDNFGNESDVDGNGKVNILCYDIQDGFSGSGGYVAGYFYSGDLYATTHSNQSEIFYIDTNPLMGTSSSKDVSAAYSTLAHEFQHMINYNQKVFVQGHSEMDTWMNEGLSMAAEQIYSGQVLNDRIDYYNYDSSIAAGHSLLYWDYNGDTLANYSLSYLFMEYLKIQCGQGNRIFTELINDPNSDYVAVEDLVKKYIDPTLTFGKFMTDFRAALLLKQNSGLYGFKGDQAFNQLKARLYSGTSTSLRGGGAYVKSINSPADFTIPVDKGPNVTYTLLSANQNNPDTPIPKKPNVNSVDDNDTIVTGTADANDKITVSVKGSQIGDSYADGNGHFNVSIPTQSAGTVLNVFAEDAFGNKSDVTTVTVVDKTAPAKPTVNSVSDRDTVVSGTAEASAKVIVKNGNDVLGIGTADEKGTFKVSINKQKAGSTLTVYAEDASENKSEEVNVKVRDKTAPSKPTVYTFGDNQTTVSGKAEAGSSITIKLGNAIIGKGTTSNKGTFIVTVKSKQKAGTTLIAYATDAAKNQSSGTSFKVIDKTAPSKPTVYTFGDNQTTVSGKAEVGSSITIKLGNTIIGQGTTSNKGTFTVTVKSKQKAGTTLIAYATDAAKNQSSGTSFKVIDKTAPSKPTVYRFGNKDTYLSGKTEAYGKITVKVGNKVIGSAKADSKGSYKAKVAKQKAGVAVAVYVTDSAGNTSSATIVKVVDNTAPSKPTVYSFGDNQTTISGKAEAGSSITIKSGKTVLGHATTSHKGTFTVKIKSKQKAGILLIAYATDKAKNQSSGTTFKVADKTAPGTPSANNVTYKSTKVTGKAEKGATVYLYNGSKYLGKATVSSKGTYSIKMKRQKKNSTLKIYAKDKAGNKSKYRYVKVK